MTSYFDSRRQRARAVAVVPLTSIPRLQGILWSRLATRLDSAVDRRVPQESRWFRGGAAFFSPRPSGVLAAICMDLQSRCKRRRRSVI